ncbi:uncharacterized protein UV8b_06173 [Ustilaginoidea virens]|uniref:Uncharacterized protein n=1 Tax=Ustilaginoidea virens TaxID=1159556 RepID=A0A8E5MJB7_USTVR|nr:uncharacterized protein UV8b_06173 [Ustilaginoidea virens]QUC21932.1 hypothetical protein UV8b_06173 [Ustilaginoidea virens]
MSQSFGFAFACVLCDDPCAAELRSCGPGKFSANCPPWIYQVGPRKGLLLRTPANKRRAVPSSRATARWSLLGPLARMLCAVPYRVENHSPRWVASADSDGDD